MLEIDYIFLSSFHWSSWFANSITTSEIYFFCLSTYFLTCDLSSFSPSFNFFPFKDKIACELRSHVVYLYGQTRRHILTRTSKHMSVSPLTGKKRSVSTMPGILAHSLISIPLNIKFHPLILKSFPLLLLKQICSFAFSYSSLILF